MTAMLDVTPRQLEIFQFIERFVAKNGYAPTRKEIADEFDLALNGVQQHLKLLEKKGALRVPPHISRGIVLLAETPKARR